MKNNLKCKIAVDAMGGDFAPSNEIIGSFQAMREDTNIEILFVGKREEIQKAIEANGMKYNPDQIIDADQVVDMSDSPTAVLKAKPNSSLVIGAKLVKEGMAQAFVSAGNTGAVLAAGTFIIGRIEGVSRPTIGAAMPTQTGGICFVYDVGTSVDSKPRHLFEYAILGSIFAREIYQIKNPKIGLLSVGEEESKGNEVTFGTFKLLKESELNFIGNVEGRDILKGTVDIVVCDGFVGNIILKFAESIIGFLKEKMRSFAEKNFLNMLKVLSMKGTLKKILNVLDYQNYGGVPLLGVNGICIIGHGSSSPLAIKNMILRAKEMHDKNLIQTFKDTLRSYANK